MREILFRGFHPCEGGDMTIYVEGKAAKGKWVEGFYFEEIGSFIKERSGSVSTSTYLVLPSTVGQYTGLTDKNGRKIFEGDIVLANNYVTGSPYNDFAGQAVYAECAYSIEPTDPKDSCGYTTNARFMKSSARYLTRRHKMIVSDI